MKRCLGCAIDILAHLHLHESALAAKVGMALSVVPHVRRSLAQSLLSDREGAQLRPAKSTVAFRH